jgi:peptidoglycan-associated lipoprotein
MIFRNTQHLSARWTGVAAAALSAALLAGCASSTKLSDTPVESRSPTPVAAAGPSTSSTAATTAATAPAAQSSVATVSAGSGAAAGAAGAAGAALLAWPATRVVYFDYDSFALRDDAKPVVDGHARVLAGNRGRKLTVEGHTDERGGREYNLALGQKRAESVAKTLVLLGAGESQVEAVSFGKERPAASGSDESAWAKNRRAELKDRP